MIEDFIILDDDIEDEPEDNRRQSYEDRSQGYETDYWDNLAPSGVWIPGWKYNIIEIGITYPG